MKATEQQIGGGHYKDMAIQPIEFITKNNIPFIEGNIIKYICRWRAKGGVEDLQKARHYLDMLIDEDQPPDNPEQFKVGDLAQVINTHDNYYGEIGSISGIVGQIYYVNISGEDVAYLKTSIKKL